MRNLTEPIEVKLTERQWECAQHDLNGGTIPEVLEQAEVGDADGPFDVAEMDRANEEMSNSGPTVILRTNIERAIFCTAVQGSATWVYLETCFAGNWDPRAEAAYQRVADNLRERAEAALGIPLRPAGSHPCFEDDRE